MDGNIIAVAGDHLYGYAVFIHKSNGILGIRSHGVGQIENGTIQDIGVRKLIRVLEFLGLELRVRPGGQPPTLDELREETL